MRDNYLHYTKLINQQHKTKTCSRVNRYEFGSGSHSGGVPVFAARLWLGRLAVMMMMMTAVLATAAGPFLMLPIGLVTFMLLGGSAGLLPLTAVMRSLLFFGLVSGRRPGASPVRINRTHRSTLAATHMFVRVATWLFVHLLFPWFFPWRPQI